MKAKRCPLCKGVPKFVYYAIPESQNPSGWYEFGHKVEALCKQYGRNYYIKDSLRKAMEAHP